MYFTQRIEDWYHDEAPSVKDNTRWIVARPEDDYGIVIRLRNGTNLVIVDQDD